MRRPHDPFIIMIPNASEERASKYVVVSAFMDSIRPHALLRHQSLSSNDGAFFEIRLASCKSDIFCNLESERESVSL